MKAFKVKRFGFGRFKTWAVWNNREGEWVKIVDSEFTFTVESRNKKPMVELANKLNKIYAPINH